MSSNGAPDAVMGMDVGGEIRSIRVVPWDGETNIYAFWQGNTCIFAVNNIYHITCLLVPISPRTTCYDSAIMTAEPSLAMSIVLVFLHKLGYNLLIALAALPEMASLVSFEC